MISILCNISSEQWKDPKLKNIIMQLKEESPPAWHHYYTLKKETLFIRKNKADLYWSLYPPDHLVKQVVLLFHYYYAHTGPLKTAHLLRNICYFPSFSKTTRCIVQACELCQKCKPKTTRIAGPLQPILSNKSLDKL